MGNCSCIFVTRTFLSQCFQNIRKKKIHQFDRLLDRRHGVTSTALSTKKSAISDYIAKALNKSHSPLLFDDLISHSSASSHFDEKNAAFTSSWISDGGTSDTSHILYREVDPISKVSPSEYEQINSFSPTTSGSSHKNGAWIAVTSTPGNKYFSNSAITHYLVRSNDENLRLNSENLNCGTHPLVEEEVDGLELARLARRLWNQNSTSKTKKTHSNVDDPNKTNKILPFVSRPTILKLRSNSQQLFPVLPKTHNTKSSFFESPEDNSSELAWDHELAPSVSRDVKSSVRDFNKSSYGLNEKLMQPNNCANEIIQPKLLENRSLHSDRSTMSSNIAILPIQNDNYDENNSNIKSKNSLPVNNWHYSNEHEKVFKNSNLSSTMGIPCTDFVNSPTNLETEENLPKIPLDNLIDSGFVGYSNGFSDAEEDQLNSDQLTDFLWEHETFEQKNWSKLKFQN